MQKRKTLEYAPLFHTSIAAIMLESAVPAFDQDLV